MLSARVASLSTLLVSLAVVVMSSKPADAWWFFSDPAGGLKAAANFDLDGVKGVIKFSQKSANEPTLVEYDLTGLKGNTNLYHVHMRPVPAYNPEQVKNNATAIAALCADPSTGGHHNPLKITAKMPPKSAPLDQYEIGDLSGKHGPFLLAPGSTAAQDHYVGSYQDPTLPMSGDKAIVGKSIVIHKNDGKRWVCASINPL